MSYSWYSFYTKGVSPIIDLPVQSIYEVFERSASRYPEQLAVVDGDHEITYSQLRQTVDGFAAVLYEKGFRKGDRMGVMLPNCLEYVISFFAIQRLGGIVLQVNPLYQQFELHTLIQDATPKWFICSQNQADKFEKDTDIYVFITDDMGNEIDRFAHEKTDKLPAIQINPKEDVAVLQYTGGTTGKSKGVMITHYNLISNISQTAQVYSPVLQDGKERIFGCTPLTHAMAMTNLNLSVLMGSTFIILEKFKATEALHAIRKYRPTTFSGTPTMYIALLHHPDLKDDDLKSFKICSSGSAPLAVEVIKALEEKSGATILEAYGLSEAITGTHRSPIGGIRKIGSVGIPLPNTEAKIMDIETGTKEVKHGDFGELVVKGPQMMKGYWKNPMATEETLKDGWLHTGDIAMRDEDGFFFIVGRKKEMIIAGGYNIYPSEVEEVLYEHPAIEEVCVFGVPDDYLGEKVMAAIILKENENVSKEDILNWCEKRIARYKVPRLVEFREALPKTTVGKILRRKLVEEYREELQNVANHRKL